MKLFLILAVALCAYAAEVKEKEDKAEPVQNKDKRQTQDELVYRVPRKQEQVAPVEEPQEEDRISHDNEEYRPGQVFSLNAQELLELQPERKAPVSNDQLLQQLYTGPQQQDHKQNLQQLFYLEPQPQSGRQVSLQPSHAVIARPHFSANGGEASVGAALSVSDTGAAPPQSFDQDLLALLGHQGRPEDNRPQTYSQLQPIQQTSAPNLAAQQHQQASVSAALSVSDTGAAAPQSFDQDLLALFGHQARQEDPRPQTYSQLQPIQQTSAPNLAAQQHQQVDRYITKPTKKTTKLRNKVQINPPQSAAAPQQYLIETTNVQQQQQPLQQYRPVSQPQRPLQSLRYVPIQQAQPAIQQVYYERPETQGLKIVPAPKLQQLQQLQQPRPQIAYRLVPQYQQPQYQQPEAAPKQYRIIELPRPQPVRQEPRLHTANVERPLTYLKRYPDPEKMRAVKIYDPVDTQVPQQPAQIIGEQYYLRPVFRQNEQRARYDLAAPLRPIEQQRPVEATKAPSSAIYVSKNLAPKKIRPQPVRAEQNVKIEQPRYEQQHLESASIEQQTQSLEEQRSHLPPPRNNKAYTPEEFAALVAAGYSVTPIPVGTHIAQSRSSLEAAPQMKRRPIYRRPQYLPVRDDAP